MIEHRRRWLAMVAGVALGIAVFGATGPSVSLAQQEDVVVGGAVDDAFIDSLIAQIFAEVFGGDVAEDDAAVSGGGDLNVGGSSGGDISVGGNMGGTVTMGGGSGGGISIGEGYSGS